MPVDLRDPYSKICDNCVQVAHPLEGLSPVAQPPHLAAQPACATLSPAAGHGALQHVDMQQPGHDAGQVPDQRRMGRQDLSEQQLHPAQVLRSTEPRSAAEKILRVRSWHGVRTQCQRPSRGHTVDGHGHGAWHLWRQQAADGKHNDARMPSHNDDACNSREHCERTLVGTVTPKTELYVGDRALRTTLRANRTAEKPTAHSLRA